MPGMRSNIPNVYVPEIYKFSGGLSKLNDYG